MKKTEPYMRQFTFVDLFCGIGGFHQAAASLGGKCVMACDIDHAAREAYLANYGIEPHADVSSLDESNVPKHDALFAGFPCQAFSLMGHMLGFKDKRGTLIFEAVRILEESRPPLVVLENVKQLKGHHGGKTLETILATLDELGYAVHWKILNALDYGLPQKRERLIMVGFQDRDIPFRFPAPTGPGDLRDVLENARDVDPKHRVSREILKKRLASHKSHYSPGIWHENKSGHISSYPYSCALRAGGSHNYLLVNGRRRLTPREMLRLQGFPDSFEIVCSDFQTRKQAGNAVPVNLVRAVLKEALRALGWGKAKR
jgi:DNA (cytosine-5)-methyltransferase 1